MTIPVFRSEQEHVEFMSYIKTFINDFKENVEKQNISEIFPDYAQNVDTVIVYKLGKTLVEWLENWRNN